MSDQEKILMGLTALVRADHEEMGALKALIVEVAAALCSAHPEFFDALDEAMAEYDRVQQGTELLLGSVVATLKGGEE